MGVGNDPRYNKTRCFDDVTLTGLYNVLAKLRAEQPLSANEKLPHEHGLVEVLRSLHDELDAAVLQAYGWADLQPALADHRPAEEAAGTVRWLRPEFQARPAGSQAGLDVAPDDEAVTGEPAAAPPAPVVRRPWPTGLPEQIKAAAERIAAEPGPGTPGPEGTRILPVHRFPVSLVYRVEAAELQVIAVAAQRRRPGDWSGRR